MASLLEGLECPDKGSCNWPSDRTGKENEQSSALGKLWQCAQGGLEEENISDEVTASTGKGSGGHGVMW